MKITESCTRAHGPQIYFTGQSLALPTVAIHTEKLFTYYLYQYGETIPSNYF